MSPRLRRIVQWLLRGLAVVAMISVVAVLVFWWHARRSLAVLDGEITFPALLADVRIERDANGVPTIHAGNRLDAARALGFLHAQDRFFGMDVNRRYGAGELAGLVGRIAVGADQWLRFFPNRTVAEEALRTMPTEDRRLLVAYTAGVNAGIKALGAAPPEYLLPGAEVRPWEPEDCILVGINMYYNLQDARGRTDEERGLIRESLPESVSRYLFQRTPQSDAPLRGAAAVEIDLPVDDWAQAIATAAAVEAERKEEMGDAEPTTPGSNAWAVGAAATADGRAILANDMHLGLQVPHVWYRASVRYEAEDGTPVAVDGPTLPGLPVWIVGSNRHLAWGFTNSYTDQTDLVAIELHPEDATRYRTADGWTTFTTREEVVEVAFGDPVQIEIKESIWGPVRKGIDGRLYAVLWMGAQREFWNMGLDQLARARNVDEALEIAHRAAVPTQNFVVVDRAGDVAWTLIGPLPDRGGFDGLFPLKAEGVGNGWQGTVPPEKIPVIRQDRIWTANQRLVGSEDLGLLGDGGYDLGYRGARIREQIAGSGLDESAMLVLQGDTEAAYLRPWRDFFLEILDTAALAEDRDRAALRERFAAWDGEAAADDATYTLLRNARASLISLLRRHLATPLGENQRAFPPNNGMGLNEIVLECLRTPHQALTPPEYDSMRDLTLDVLDSIAGAKESDRPWGEVNALRMRHPIMGPIPFLGDLFSMPLHPQSGDAQTVRVLRPGFGASQRMVVSPGREEDGYYHQPGGASGHFLSSFFRRGHEDWVALKPSPFLPGPAKHTLMLKMLP